MSRRSLVTILLLSIALKFVYFAFSLAVSQTNLGFHNKCNTQEFFSLFKRNDSYWYQKAAEQGYPAISNPLELGYSYGKYFRQSVWAMFPLYPLAVRYTAQLFHLSFDHSAFLLSILFAALCYISFYLLCRRLFNLDDRKSLLFTLFFMCFPFHYFFSMYYTEAMYFTFMALSFYGVATRKFWMTGLMLIPLVLVRPNGIFCLVPLAALSIEMDGGYKLFYDRLRSFRWQPFAKYFWFATALVSFGAYCIYQKYMTGFYFAFVKAQAGWYKTFMFPFLALFRRSDLAFQINSIYTVVIMIVSLFTLKRFPLSLHLFIWLSLLLPLSSGSTISMVRYVSAIFPLTIFMTSFLAGTRWKYFFLGAVFLLQLITFYPWLIGDPLSF